MNISNITYGKKYAAIEYAENTIFNYLQLTKKKDEFNVSKEEQFRSLEQVKEELKTQKHLFLIVNNFVQHACNWVFSNQLFYNCK